MDTHQALKERESTDELEGVRTREALLGLARSRPHDKSVADLLFRDYEKSKEHDENYQLAYFQLKWLHEQEKWKYLNKISDLYLHAGRYSIAFMSLILSLRANPDQAPLFELAESIKESAKPKIRSRLKEDRCSISIVMRTYERGRELRESIRSVLNQSFKDFELIVINNGGCDELKGVVDSFGSARIKYHKLDRKRELGGALNEGILRSEGKYVAYLDDDDVYYPNHLETVMRFVEKHPNTDFVYSNAWWCYGAVEGERFLEKSRAVLDWRPKKFDRDLLFYINYISTLNALHRRDCLRTTGLFNEDLAVFEDWDLWMRLACNYTFFQLNELTGEYRIKRNNTTQVDQLNMAFLGNVMGPYYEFDSANAVFVMNYLRRGQRKKAQELYESMVSNYSHCTLKAKKNLFYLSKHFPYWRSKRLFGRLAVDYLKAKVKHYAARGWRRNTGDNTTAI